MPQNISPIRLIAHFVIAFCVAALIIYCFNVYLEKQKEQNDLEGKNFIMPIPKL